MVEDSTPEVAEVEEIAVVEDQITDAVTEVEPEAEAEVVEEVRVEEPVKNSRRSKAAAASEEVPVDAIPPVAEVVPFPTAQTLKVSLLVYSPTRKNSGSVAMLQKRLSDVGYAAARSDLRGWFHDGTRAALEKWQSENGLDVTGTAEFEDMRYLFDGTDIEILP